jgi:hypothetical protein
MTARSPFHPTPIRDDDVAAVLSGTRADGGTVAHAVARLSAEFPLRHATVVSATVTRCRAISTARRPSCSSGSPASVSATPPEPRSTEGCGVWL